MADTRPERPLSVCITFDYDALSMWVGMLASTNPTPGRDNKLFRLEIVNAGSRQAGEAWVDTASEDVKHVVNVGLAIRGERGALPTSAVGSSIRIVVAGPTTGAPRLPARTADRGVPAGPPPGLSARRGGA